MYLLDELQCKFLWQTFNTGLPTCTKSSQYEKLLNMMRDLEVMGSMGLYEKTGCLPSCHRSEFDTKMIMTKTMASTAPPLNPSSVDFTLYYIGTHYKKKVQYLMFTVEDMFASIGGFMGLLLGHSVMSLYDIVKIMYQKMSSYWSSPAGLDV
jgi:hypothetical protein